MSDFDECFLIALSANLLIMYLAMQRFSSNLLPEEEQMYEQYLDKLRDEYRMRYREGLRCIRQIIQHYPQNEQLKHELIQFIIDFKQSLPHSGHSVSHKL